MDYSDARKKIKSGDVLAWTHHGWDSWYNFQIQMVRAVTQSEYSHVGIAYTLADRVFILESVGSGIRMYPLSSEIPFFWLPIPIEWTPEVEAVAMSKMGQKYSKIDGFKSLWSKIKPGEDDQWECAEYASFILQSAKINIDCRNTPSEVVSWVQDNLDAPLYTVNRDSSNGNNK